ncbi:MopE-related protein [Sorangium sp. So ce1389]|uniref:MopE-related protein n=1 Tax=Sorangium sp. So ce1389 TaxID=3133336 RepID=UPI003F627075
MRKGTARSVPFNNVAASLAPGRWAAILLGVVAGCTPSVDGDGGVGGSGGSGGDTSVSSSGSGGSGGDTSVSSSGSGGSGGDTSVSSSGSGGSGGDGGDGGQGGGGAVCTPGSQVACPYSGPPGTQGVGRCTAGLRTCDESGTGYGPCEGEVLPAPEDCSAAEDEDCDGLADGDDADCVCVPGTEVICYSGDLDTLGVGACKAGTARCREDGSGFGPCLGEVLPAAETCLTPADDDCDGQTNEEGAGCACLPGEVIPCYSGPPGTEGTGRCAGGTARCDAQGTGFGPCEGEVVPAPETCATPVDDDCDGQTNEEGAGCACLPDAIVPCYSGPPGTEGVGRCVGGTARCRPDGTQLGPCVGEVLPAPETCLTPLDDDCDGQVNEEGASCVCPPSQRVSCYSGPPGTADVGVCASGTALCDAQGTSLGPCEGEALPQPESCATPADDDCDGEVNEGGSDCAPGITAQWAKQLSGISISAVAVDAFGNTIIAGSLTSTVDLGAGPLVPRGVGPEAFVAKFDPSGEALFAITFEGDDAGAHDIATDASGNIALLGRFTEHVPVGLGGIAFEPYHRIVKLDPSGGFLWKTDFKVEVPDGSREFQNAVAMNAAGDVVVVGTINQSWNEWVNGLVRKLDGATGALTWQKRVGDHDDQVRFDDVAARENGEIVTVGSVIFIQYLPTDVIREGCAELMTLSPAGEELDRTCVGTGETGTGEEETWRLALDPSGHAVLGSTVRREIADPYQGRVSQLDGAATALWSRDVSPVLRMQLGVDGLGNVVLAGSFAGTLGLGGSGLTSSGSADMYLARLDPDGNFVFSESYGDAGSQRLMHLGVSADGAAVIAGTFAGAITLGESTLVAATAEDTFLAKVSF